MRNKSILTKTMRRLMLMVLLVTQVVMGTSSAFADTVTGSVTFDSSVWGTTNRQFDNGSTQTWTNYLTLTLNPVTAGDNCRISGGYLGLYHQSTLEITAPVGCTITGMTIAGSNYGGTPSTTPGSLTSEPGSTSYTWTGSSSSVTISTDAGEHDSYDFQSIVVTYETSLDAMATTTSNGAIYSFNQNPNPFFGVSLYAKTITAGNQEMYFDAFGSDDPMIMQNLVDSSFYLHMPAQSRLRLQRSDSSSDIYITKAVFTFVSGSPSISPDGGTYNSSTHTWTGQESQIIFLFNEEADIQLIESEAGLLYSLAITSEGGGSVSYTASSGSGTVGANNSNSFMVNDGEEVMLTFTPSSDAYKVVAATVNGTNVFDALTIDGTYTIPSVTGNLTVYGGFDINESVNQRISLLEVPFWLHEDGLWGLNAPKNTQITPDWVVGESTGQPYGYSGVSHWADLSGYDKLVVTVTEGTPRILMNRDMDEGYWNENEEESHMIEYPQSDGAWSNKYFSKETTTNGDVYTVDLKQMKTDKGFVHLHAIKGANWQNVTVTSMMVELDGNPKVVITSSGDGTVDWSIPTGVGVVNANSQSDTISVQYDGELTLTFTPNTGYHLAHAYVNNVDYVSQMSGNVLTLHVTQHTTVRAVFATDTNNVQLTADMFYDWDGFGPLAQKTGQTTQVYVVGEPTEVAYGDPNVISYADLSAYSRLEVTVTEGTPRFLFNREYEYGQWCSEETLSHEIEYPNEGWSSKYFSHEGNVWSVDLKQMVADKGYAHLHAIKAPWNTQITVTKMELVDDGDNVYPEAYAVPSEGNTTLTFYYDTNKSSHEDAMSVVPFSSSESRGWDSYASNITKVEFDKSFANCLTLTSMANWFMGCNNLATINGARYIKTAEVTDMQGMFFGCSSLTSLDLSSFNTAKVSTMLQMFFGCSALTTIYVGSGWTVASLSGGEVMFEGCASLVGGYGTAYDADYLENSYARIDHGTSNPGYLTGKEPLINEMMFAWDGVGAGAQKTSQAYSAYVVGKSADIAFGNANVDIDVYVDLSSYSRLEVTTTTGTPRFLLNRDVTDGLPSENEAESHLIDNTHEGCMAWASKYFSSKPIDGGTLWTVNLEQLVQDKGFAHLHAIKGANDANITVTKMDLVVAQNVAIEPEAYAVLSEENTKLTFYYDNQKESRGGMGVGPFAGASERGWDSQSFTITSVVFDSSFANDTTLTSTAWWFYNCHGLTTISGISYLNTANVTDMIYMFHGCFHLTSLDVSAFNTANVADMFGMFNGCFGLTSLDVSHFNTANVTNMHSMFMNCSGLTTLDLSSFNTANVTDMRQLFSGCSNLTTIYAGNGWNTEKIIDGSEMFAGCTVLVGGAGTTFDTDHTDASYAHIDGGESSPGYFTAAGEEPFQESKNWSVVGTLAGSSESGVTMIAIDETNYTATFTLLPAGVYEYKVRDDNNIDRTYGQPDGSDVTVTVPEDNYSVTILFNAKTKAVSHELAEPIYSVIGFTSADGSGRSEFVMQRDSVGVPYTVSTSVSMGTRTFKISINHEDSVYYGKKGQLKGEAIAFYTPMAGMNVTFYFDPVTKLATTSVGIIKDKYAVHVSVAGNGSVVATETDDTGTEQSSTIVNGTSEEDVEVTEDNTLTLTLQPADGNHLVSLIVDGVDVTSQIEDNKYMLPAIAETHTVSVTYVQNDLEPYAALSDDNTVLTFYYDNLKEARNGMSVGPFNSSAERGWHEQRENITKVVFDNSFADCDTLTSTASWFAECGNLATIEDLNLLKTANVKGMHGMFYGCSSLTSIDLSNFNTANVTNMHEMFYGCSSLTSLDLSNFNTANVTEMGSMFAYCSYLSGVDVSSFNTTNVTDMMSMFYFCSSLTNLDVSNFNTANVTEMSSMFADCHSLISLDVSNFNTSKVTDIRWMFKGSSGLKTIYVGSGWSTEAVTEGGDMFAYCTSLVGGKGTVYDADHTDYTYAHIDGGAANPGYLTPQGGYVEAPTFTWNGDNLTMTTGTEGATIYYTMADNSSATTPPTAVQYTSPVAVTNDVLITAYAEKEGMAQSPATVLDYPYTAWKALTDAIAAAQTVSAQAATNDNVSDTQRTELTTLITAAQDAYAERTEAKVAVEQRTATLTAYTQTIQNLVNAENEPYAVMTQTNSTGERFTLTFYYDKKKEERNGFGVGPFDGSQTYRWGGKNPSYIKKIVFDESFDQCTSITSTAYWFRGCSGIFSTDSIVGLQYLHTDNVIDMKYMFEGMYSLAGVLDLSTFNTENVTDMAYMFSRCSTLDGIVVSNFNTAKVTDMKWMFDHMEKITTLDLTSFNTASVTYMDYMFQVCSALETIYIGSAWTTASLVAGGGSSSAGGSMFYNCHKLVGGLGTVYDGNHTNAEYAHIDGGPSNPGYLTLKLAMGDANGDSNINIADAVATVTNILGQPTAEVFYQYAADMNNDKVIDIFDVTLIVNAALNAPAPGRRGVTRSGTDEVPAEAIQLMADTHNVYMDIDQAQQYTALQFDMDLPEGTDLLGVRLLGDTDHQLSFVKRGDSQYRVIALSMNNEVFRSANGHLIQLQVSNNIGENNVKMSDVLFVKPSGKTVTGIGECLNTMVAKDDSIYNLQGEKLGKSKQQLGKGIYIINHKKVMIK